ncbi:MAG TPA: LysR family transcriptional regulator, partial [Archangium sp.]
MDRLHAMNAFVTVAELRGFAPAARKLKLSPSVVTRLVAALEERLSTRLLQRTTRSVKLTDAGARYLDRARRILADVTEAEAQAQADRIEPSGRFVVTAPQVFGRIHVAPLMCEFLEQHPKVIGELTLGDRAINLVEEGVDAAIRIGPLADSSVIARAVGATRRVVVAAPRYLKRAPPLRKPEDVAKHPLIQFTGLGAMPHWNEPRFVTNSADAAIAHAELGGGLTMALGYQVIAAVKAKRLVVVLEDFEPPPLPIHVLYPS